MKRVTVYFWFSNSQPPDHDSTFHVTETPALTPRPSVTSSSLTIPSTDAVYPVFFQHLIVG